LISIEWRMHEDLALCSAGVATASGKRKERECIDRHDCCSSNWEGETSNPAGNLVPCVRAHIPGSAVYMCTEGEARTFCVWKGLPWRINQYAPPPPIEGTFPRNDRWWNVEGTLECSGVSHFCASWEPLLYGAERSLEGGEGKMTQRREHGRLE